MLLDNLRAHKTTTILEKMSELGIEHIYNVPYQPDYNPSESCFSKVKNYYKRQKLNLLVNERDIDYKSLIDRSINELTK